MVAQTRLAQTRLAQTGLYTRADRSVPLGFAFKSVQYKLATGEFSISLVSVTEKTGLSLALSEALLTGFDTTAD